MESLIIGIAGGSGSGKSTFTNRIKKRFGDDVVVLYHDNYYRRQDGIPFEQRVTVNYDHPDLTRRWAAYNPKNREEIIEARTFGFYKDLKKFQMLGFAQGVNIENTLGLQDEGYTSPLRSENEPVKHKILDLIGDFYLTGVNPLNLKCQILAKEAGHAVHVKVAKMLKEKLIECK